MKDDSTTNSHYITYASLCKRLGAAVALAFEEVGPPDDKICVQKFGNVYQRKKKKKRKTHFKSTFTSGFIKRIRKIKCSQAMRASLSQSSSVFGDRLPRVPCSLRRVETVVRVLLIYGEICVNATPVGVKGSA